MLSFYSIRLKKIGSPKPSLFVLYCSYSREAYVELIHHIREFIPGTLKKCIHWVCYSTSDHSLLGQIQATPVAKPCDTFILLLLLFISVSVSLFTFSWFFNVLILLEILRGVDQLEASRLKRFFFNSFCVYEHMGETLYFLLAGKVLDSLS